MIPHVTLDDRLLILRFERSIQEMEFARRSADLQCLRRKFKGRQIEIRRSPVDTNCIVLPWMSLSSASMAFSAIRLPRLKLSRTRPTPANIQCAVRWSQYHRYMVIEYDWVEPLINREYLQRQTRR